MVACFKTVELYFGPIKNGCTHIDMSTLSLILVYKYTPHTPLHVHIHMLHTGALAMEALHRQVLPFLLRRMKEDVLQDLPPKIIQDYHCELSPLQVYSFHAHCMYIVASEHCFGYQTILLVYFILGYSSAYP